MKNILIVFIAVITFTLSSCKKEPNKGVMVLAHMDIAYKDNMGNDLLNPSTTNYFSSGMIHVYNIVNGIKVEVNNPLMDYPHDFMIYKDDSFNLYRIRVFLGSDAVLLQLNQSITDTITCTFDRSNGNLLLTNLWYNSVLKWDSEHGGENGGYTEITIVK